MTKSFTWNFSLARWPTCQRFAGNELAAPYIRQQKKCGNLDVDEDDEGCRFSISWVVSNQSEKYIWMFPKIVGFPPKSSIFNRVFHYFHHPFFGYPYFWKHPYKSNLIIIPRQEWNSPKYVRPLAQWISFSCLLNISCVTTSFRVSYVHSRICHPAGSLRAIYSAKREATFSSWGVDDCVGWCDRDHRITRCTSKLIA